MRRVSPLWVTTNSSPWTNIGEHLDTFSHSQPNRHSIASTTRENTCVSVVAFSCSAKSIISAIALRQTSVIRR
jgi:hypothetical protein